MGLRKRLSKCLPGKSETLTLDPQEQYVEWYVLEIQGWQGGRQKWGLVNAHTTSILA